jgi:PelA/Pel-15E family pectate lyase
MHDTFRNLALGLAIAVPATTFAAVIGVQTAAQPVTDARLATLDPAQRAQWQAWLARSNALRAADDAALAAERGAGPAPADPPENKTGGSGMPLDRDSAWYGSTQARHAADVIVSFQTPAGGWGKNVRRDGPLRERGQSYVIGHSYVGTIDNGATVTELRFLARVQAQLPGPEGQAYRDAFLKGARYLLNAQYPNGGFAQVYPLQGGYHDAITFNDDAMAHVLTLLALIAERRDDYRFVPAALAGDAREAIAKAVRLLLAAQVVAGGVRTGWGQQHDALTLMPAGARNYEPASLASHESASVLMFLMQLPDPSPEVVRAVHAGAAWLRQVALHDTEWTHKSPEGRRLVSRPGAPLLWARYYDLASMKPIFGERDHAIHDDVMDLLPGRRNGYGWFVTGPSKALAAYDTWSRARSSLPPIRLILVGDSTIASGNGYGDALCARFKPEVDCVNLAANGRSSSSFRAEGRWDKVQRLLREGGQFRANYVLVQFGHNDQPGKKHATDLVTEFPANMARYAAETRALGGVPVLVTPLTRRTFKGPNLHDTLAPWGAATRKAAEQEHAALLDLNADSAAAVQRMGQAEADTLAVAPAPAKAFDWTHVGPKGAAFFSAIVADELVQAMPALAPYLGNK